MTTRRRITTAEIEAIRARYPHERTSDIAASLGRSVSAIYQEAYRLGLRKSAEFFLGTQSGRLKDGAGAATRFQPGQQPWNKGAKGWQAGGRSVETQFRRGQMPHNTKSVGDYRIDRQGTLQRKIGTAKGSNSKRWRGVHELVWIAAHGPVPDGHLVVFKPGMRTAELEEITLDRVECISRAENMRRNSYHTNYPKEIAELIQLRGALVRKINRRTRNNEQPEQRDHR